jgi:hypothetical protein
MQAFEQHCWLLEQRIAATAQTPPSSSKKFWPPSVPQPSHPGLGCGGKQKLRWQVPVIRSHSKLLQSDASVHGCPIPKSPGVLAHWP